ncbi:hypothetical protein B5E58_11350, partial [Tyzzerella sp. An114]|uniref:hypothetical protein n=1 Tax=Tyzzerella sp. An114 TaxID=1965545 RepID=UPI000B561522
MLNKFKSFLEENIIFSMLVGAILGGLISWTIVWFFPSKPVEINNVPQKELTCILNYSQSLVSKYTNDDRFQITYDGEIIEEPYIYSITIKNTGSYEISNEDFKNNFIIDFEGCNKIINAKVVNSTKKEVTDEILSNSKFEGTNFIFNDFFLNPNEGFTINIITNGKATKIYYDYR